MNTVERQVLVHLCQFGLRLQASGAALSQEPEALHRLRIDLSRLRALLRLLPGLEELKQAAADLARFTAPVRERQVFAQMLARQAPALALPWLQEQQRACAWLQESVVLQRLLACLAPAPGLWLRQGQRVSRQQVRRALRGQWQQCAPLLQADPAGWHALRLGIKRLRYGSELFALAAPVRLAQLRRLQVLLGDWHDRQGWVQLAGDDAALRPCAERWQREAEILAAAIQLRLQRLAPV